MMKFFEKYKNQLPIVLLILVLLSAIAVGGTFGKYVMEKQSNADTTITAEGVISLSVAHNGGNSYTVTNTDAANAPAYARFTVVVTWRAEADGKLWATGAVEGVDYKVSAANCTALSSSQNNYYYFKGTDREDAILLAGESFSFNVEQLTTKTGYTMCIEILADAVQCVPESTPVRVWGVSYNKNTRTWSKS